MPSQLEIARIASAMHAVRPDWRVDSLITFLTKHHADRAYGDLARAAFFVALDERTTTPNLLNQHGPWWVAAYLATTAATETPGPGREPACDKPGHERELQRRCRACRSEQIASER